MGTDLFRGQRLAEARDASLPHQVVSIAALSRHALPELTPPQGAERIAKLRPELERQLLEAFLECVAGALEADLLPSPCSAAALRSTLGSGEAGEEIVQALQELERMGISGPAAGGVGRAEARHLGSPESRLT